MLINSLFEYTVIGIASESVGKLNLKRKRKVKDRKALQTNFILFTNFSISVLCTFLVPKRKV